MRGLAKHIFTVGVALVLVITPLSTFAASKVAVRGVYLNMPMITLVEKYSTQLKVTISPLQATNKKVVWRSSNAKVVKVDTKGKVTAVAAGNAVVTVESVDGKKRASTTIRVIKSSPAGSTAKKLGPASVSILVNPEKSLEKDSDGDLLSDYDEVNKYKTDPSKLDTDGDGKADNDENERREYTYSISHLINVLKPVNLAMMTDDYQDAKLIKDYGPYVQVEVITYPLNTNKQAIKSDPNWRTTVANNPKLQPYLKPGNAANFDEKMQMDLLMELKSHGIDPSTMDDKTLVEKTARYILQSSKFLDIFGSYVTTWNAGEPKVYEPLRNVFEANKGNKSWSDLELFQHEALGKEMFYNKAHGSCTSSSVYWTAILRAIGIPTRTVIAIPPFNVADSSQYNLLNQLSHAETAKKMFQGTDAIRGSFAAHTFNEVFVGGRWVRLNYDNLGQPLVDVNYFGELIHINTFNDLSEVDLATTWAEYVYGKVGFERFSRVNPYQTLSMTDLFGTHSGMTKDVVGYVIEEHKIVHANGVYWGNQIPDAGLLTFATNEGHLDTLVIRMKEWFPDQNYRQYSVFRDRLIDGQLGYFGMKLVSKSGEVIQGTYSGTFYTDANGVYTLFVSSIKRSQLKDGEAYSLVFENPAGSAYQVLAEGEILVKK